MKDRDNHTHRTGYSLVLQPRDRSLGVDALIRNIRILAKTTANFGAWLDYSEALPDPDRVDACLVIEYDRTRKPGRNRDASYRCFRDEALAERYLAGKLNLICSVADAMGLDVLRVGNPYTETL